MKIFISSLIRGLEPYREAAASAIATLGHQPVRAEDFGARPETPQQACLAGVRSSNALVLLLGTRYGHVQASGRSATHEEYREARDTRPVLVFIENDVDPEPAQAAFIREVQAWEHGHFTAAYTTPESLRDSVIRAVHNYVLANEATPLNEGELAKRALEMVPGGRTTGGTSLVVAIAGGPTRAVLRPAELENENLVRFVLAEALTGDNSVLMPSVGTQTSVRGNALLLTQDGGSAGVTLDETANLVIVQPALENDRWRGGIASLIEETVSERMSRAIRFSARVLDHVDPVQRITHVAPVVAVHGAGYLPWRTRAEQERSPNAASMGLGAHDNVVVAPTPPVQRRSVLHHDTDRLVEDLVIRLRREVGKH